METRFKQTLARVIFGILLIGFTSFPAGAREFKALYVFGDSLSDPGNASALTEGTFPYPVAYPFGRFSNGIVTPEYLADVLKVPRLAFYEDPQGTNFAIGGATTGYLNYNFAVNSPDLHLYPVLSTHGVQGQILDAIAQRHPFNRSKTLFLVSGGANDVFLSLTLDPTGTNLPSDLNQAVENLSEGISLLVQNGARSFVVVNLPNLGASPGVNANPYFASLLNFVSMTYNAALSSAVAQLKEKFGSRIEISVFDAYTLVNEVIESPSGFGFTNVMTSCLSDAQQPDCAGYLFYDNVHPTTAAHRLIAERLYQSLEN